RLFVVGPRPGVVAARRAQDAERQAGVALRARRLRLAGQAQRLVERRHGGLAIAEEVVGPARLLTGQRDGGLLVARAGAPRRLFGRGQSVRDVAELGRRRRLDEIDARIVAARWRQRTQGAQCDQRRLGVPGVDLRAREQEAEVRVVWEEAPQRLVAVGGTRRLPVLLAAIALDEQAVGAIEPVGQP